jgi:phosphate transport system substrate-binding protein
MRNKFYPVFAVLFIMALVLSACASAAPAPVAQQPTPEPVLIEVTRIVENTPETVIITATPERLEPTATPLPRGSVQINGAGATFPLPIYSEWTYAYQYVDTAVAINYQGIGSGGGKKAIIDNTVDFAGTDSLLKAEEYEAGKDLQMIPIVAGAVVPIYNIVWTAENTNKTVLILDGETLVGIYNAEIKKWNDPSIVALNPELKDLLPDAPITAVHRSDGSGTTELFTKALASFSDKWTAGAAASVEWPVALAGTGIGGRGNPGVAAGVQNTPNSIGYVELSYAKSNNIPFAKLINKAGNTVAANAESLQSAMNDFAGDFSPELTNTIIDAPGANSWPIAGYTYLIIRMESMPDCLKAEKLLDYIVWTLTEESAGKRAAELGYAVLSPSVTSIVLDKLDEVKCNNAPVRK